MNGSTMRSRNKSKIPWKKWKWGHNNLKSVGHWESNPEKELHSITGLSQKKTRKSSKNLTSHLKELEKEQQTKPKVSRRKEIIKIRAEINEIKHKKDTKDQRIQELILWKDKQDEKTLTRFIKKKKR